jgi:hypothetical protein
VSQELENDFRKSGKKITDAQHSMQHFSNEWRSNITKSDGVKRPLVKNNLDLAFLAQQTVDTCVFEHMNFPWVSASSCTGYSITRPVISAYFPVHPLLQTGQNLCIWGPTAFDDLAAVIDYWFTEYVCITAA